MDKQNRVLLCATFALKDTVWELVLSGVGLSWREGARSGQDTLREGSSYRIPLAEIIGVRETLDLSESVKAHKLNEAYPCAFTVSYIQRTTQHHWRCADVTFRGPSRLTCRQWIQTIREQLLLLSQRPRRLLVYINPIGGRKQGKQIYDQKVAPLFSHACISCDVIVTERTNHAKEHLMEEANLKIYDGVVCVGGDGLFNEVIHGLICRMQQDAGVVPNHPEVKMVPCRQRVGIIPAGSTDCVCYATVGVNDPATSALHIIVGDSQLIDVSSVHQNNTLVRFSVSLLGYGFYGNILDHSEKMRWMGPFRYSFSGLKTFLTQQSYEGTVSFLPATDCVGSPRDKAVCRAGCSVCQHNHQLLSEDKHSFDKEELSNDWQVIKGKFLAINAATISCACPRSPKGLSPAAHLADGTTDLILVQECSALDFLQHLVRHVNKHDQFDMEFVEVYRVRRFSFTPTSQSMDLGSGLIPSTDPACPGISTRSQWTCDGEIIADATIDVRVHYGLVKLFARGIEEASIFEEPSPSFAT